nr:deleted in malignant brain tumors 1 protein-like isoform X1 [Lytechinus pictus]XP_054748402.1 deleted in malignant brain tumors 1 protein-like isoform X1 [Lytechinus pictus]
MIGGWQLRLSDFLLPVFLVLLSASQGLGALRLVNGDERSGRLEVYYNETWGTVCSDSFAIEDARVACRQLFPSSDTTSVEYFDSSKYGEGTGHIWLDQVSCIGLEATLDSCVHNAYGDHDCTHSQDVGISCETGESERSGGGYNFWSQSGSWTGTGVGVFICFIVGGSAYKRRQMRLRQMQQHNGVVHPPCGIAGACGTGGNPRPFTIQTPPAQPSEPRPYPVQTYSPVYPPPVQDPSGYPTQLPPVENTGPYPPPYPTNQPGDVPPLNQPQSGIIQEGDLPPPPSYNDIVKR